MKVLFAVNNENISEAIVKKYQSEYKEIISYKNVYYFNAILKEIQKDKFYDRIVISEELETFAHNNYDVIDKFLFEKLDNISDEATDNDGTDTPIILICTDRRKQSDNMLVKLFGIGVYNALIGKDRSMDEVCKLINKPRLKKEAKNYYKIDVDDVKYKVENQSDVSEAEIQNILSHYKKLGKDEEKYADSFNNIASQYTDAQLKVIIKFLPLNVKAVLEANSPKYQEIITFANNGNIVKKNDVYTNQNIQEAKIASLENKKNISGKSVIIPSAVKTNDVNKINLDEEEQVIESKKGRGRPKKIADEEEVIVEKKGRGRPKKIVEEPVIEEEATNLFDLDEDEEEIEEVKTEEIFKPIQPIQTYKPEEISKNVEEYVHRNPITTLISKDKKIVSFVGTSKNGTSFIVNNLALLFSLRNINTAVLDLTTNKNSYYIYTKNDEKLRQIAYNSIEKLRSGIAEGIKVNKNLTVYTALPGEQNNFSDVENILSTLVKNYSLVLIDTDFNTNKNYFLNSQEIYLVQSMDVLTIQPLTEFLRDLKGEEILSDEKIKIIINKECKINGITPKVIVGGMAFYNDPAMSFMTELFNREMIKYLTIPFDENVYSRYLESIATCNVSLNGYSKQFMEKLRSLGNIVYPLINKQTYNSI